MERSDADVNPPFSPSVRAAASRTTGEVESVELVRRLLASHPEYGGGRARRLELAPTGGGRRSADAWLELVAGWVRDQRLDVDVIHGKLALVALADLDPALEQQLREGGFLRAVQSEMGELPRAPLRDQHAADDRTDAPDAEGSAVFMHEDNAAVQDLLNRRPFAEFLAARLRKVSAEMHRAGTNGAFLLHVDGPWGSGKTTLLTFMEQALRKPVPRPAVTPGSVGGAHRAVDLDPEHDPWIVVTFNAWRHQHIDPPWWALREAVVGAVVDQTRKRWILLEERLWRFWSPIRPHAVVLSIVAAMMGLLILLAGRTQFFGLGGAAAEYTWSSFLVDVGRFVGIVTGVWAVAAAALQRLSPSLPRGAQAFVESQEDAMGLLRARFHAVLQEAGRPVAIFIDDLDRCDPEYVVRLIEGIQTLFRDTLVTYVVAGDGRWIEGSFDEHHRALQPAVSEEGRTLGHLFLQKTFQVTVEVPPITNTGEFWDALLAGRDSRSAGATIADHDDAEVRAQLRETSTPQEIDRAVSRARREDPSRYAIWVKESLERELDPDVVERTENALRGFHSLLDRNPRTMKRFVNAYAIQRAAAKYAGALDDADLDEPWKQLALWTIVQMRWPTLARRLRADPSLLRVIVDEEIPESMREEQLDLLLDPRVQQVVKGDEVGVSLTEEAIRAFYALPVGRELVGSHPGPPQPEQP